MENSGIFIYGAGGHAKTVINLILAIGIFNIMGIIDDTESLIGSKVLGFPVIGTRNILNELANQGMLIVANGVGGVPNINHRTKIFELLDSFGFIFPTLIHPSATIEKSAQIFDGVQIFANAYIGSSTILQEKSIVNTGSIISNDCAVGKYSHITPGSRLAENVIVGESVLLGMGVTVRPGVKIGSGARIGNGAIILGDVDFKQIIPAGKIWSGLKQNDF